MQLNDDSPLTKRLSKNLSQSKSLNASGNYSYDVLLDLIELVGSLLINENIKSGPLSGGDKPSDDHGGEDWDAEFEIDPNQRFNGKRIDDETLENVSC